MKGILDRLKTALTDLWNRTSKKDRLRFFTITGVALIVIIVAVSALTRTKYAVMARNLDPATAGEMLASLQAMGIPTQTDGPSTILVPQEQVSELQMEMARQGFNKSGFTYELFARGSGFGTTEYEKRMYALFDTQDRLSVDLRSVPGILDAKVMIAQQDNRSAYTSAQVVPTTASVMLTLDPSISLSQENVSVIESLVSHSVEGLLAENVFITDQSLRRLNRREIEDLDMMENNHQMELAVRDDFVQNIMSILVPVFGADNVRVTGAVGLNFDNHSTESVVFTPVIDDKGIELSLRTISEKAKGTATTGGVPGIDDNGGAPTYPEVDTSNLSDYSRVSQEINYEVNQTLDKIQHARGTISDLSFSVVINTDKLSADNNSAEAVQNLVACAVGLDKAEYDRIAVAFQKFDGAAANEELMKSYEDARSKAELYNLIKIIALYLVIGVCVILIFYRIFRFFNPKVESEVAEDVLEQIEQSGEDAELQELMALATDPGNEEITVVKSPARQRVEEFTEKNPEAVASILRAWINEDPKRAR